MALALPTVIRCMNLGDALDQTLGQSRHVACRIKLYVDENFP